MRCLGIDYGLHMGISVSDEKNIFAYPLCVLNKKNNIIEELRKIIENYKITHIIMGNPLNLDGSISDKSKEVLKFRETLKQNFQCEIILIDERLTTVEANKVLQDTKGRKRKKVIDAVSATIILDSYLNKINKGDI